jgi:hypothetical protein
VFAVNKSQSYFHAAKDKLGCLLRPMRTPRDSADWSASVTQLHPLGRSVLSAVRTYRR